MNPVTLTNQAPTIEKMRFLPDSHPILDTLTNIVLYDLSVSVRYRWVSCCLKGQDRVVYGKFFQEMADDRYQHSNEALSWLAYYGGQFDIEFAHESNIGTEMGEVFTWALNVEETKLSLYNNLSTHSAPGNPDLEAYAQNMIKEGSIQCHELRKILMGLN